MMMVKAIHESPGDAGENARMKLEKEKVLTVGDPRKLYAIWQDFLDFSDAERRKR